VAVLSVQVNQLDGTTALT